MYLLFCNHRQCYVDFKLEFNGVEIPRVCSAKLLGTWIDDKLTWDTHVNKLLAKLKSGIGMLQCSKNLLTSRAKRCLYFGQIHSNLCYCLSIWGTMIQKRLLSLLVNAQRKAVKLIDPTKSIDDSFIAYKILPFDKLVRLEQCKLGYKLCDNLLPAKLALNMKQDNKKQSTVKTHRYPTQNKKIPNLPQACGSKYRTSFLFKAITEYSDLNA